jgi:isopentenyl-diphosphate Delta-isomerase
MNMITDDIILVNDADIAIGTMNKMEAHEKGLLHRAFSVFIFNSKGEMLLQQRAVSKYHSGGLWTNACCSHPRPGETTIAAAERRLAEELGFTTPLKKIFEFTYKTDFNNGLTEFEFDHVFTGVADGPFFPDPNEVQAYCFKSLEAIKEALLKEPLLYTSWFHIAIPKLQQYLKSQTELN